MTEIGSLSDIMRKMPSEHHAHCFLERLIWPTGRVCPHCGGFENTAIKGRSAGPRVYQFRHRECRRQFTITTCTPMHAAKLGLQVWIMAMFRVLSSRKRVSSMALARTIGVNQMTAWKMGHAIRQMMTARDDLCGMLGGPVEVDGRSSAARRSSRSVSIRTCGLAAPRGRSHWLRRRAGWERLGRR